MNQEGRGLSLTQANLQAQKNARLNTDHGHSVMGSVANSVIGDLPTMGGGGGGMRMSKRNSLSSTIDHYAHSYTPHKSVRLENTYRMTPNDGQRFNAAKVKKLVNEILRNHLENFKYEANKCNDMVELLSEEIKTRTKSIVYKRYKLVVYLTIGQNFDNSVVVASRSLWNPETDNECTVTFTNKTLYAVATVYACYFD